jgi:glycosyltransferase involved in cell wall biosynthesis
MRAAIVISEHPVSTTNTLRGIIGSEIEKLYVIHDYVSLALPFLMRFDYLPKVQTFITPSWAWRSTVGRTMFKLLLLTFVLMKHRPDIVIGWHTDYAPIAFLGAALFHRPLVACIDDSPRTWRRRNYLLPLLKRAHCVTTTGTSSRNRLIKRGLPADSLFIMPNGIDIGKFQQKAENEYPRYDLVTVNRLSPEKNLDTFLEAVVLVCKKIPDVRVAIVGDGPLREALQLKARQLGLDHNVVFAGWRDPQPYFRLSKVFVTTTVSEGLPVSMLQAMASGLPCVVSGIDDIPDIAKDGINSLVIPNPYDACGFADAIRRLLNNEALRTELGENSRRLVQKYSFQNASTSWNTILQHISTNRS